MSISETATANITKPPKVTALRMIGDDEIERALDFLTRNAVEIGKARARLVKAGHMIKHVEAMAFMASTQKSAEARKYDARASEQYLRWIEEEAEAAGEFEKMKALREAAALKIDAWRTESSTLRTVKI